MVKECAYCYEVIQDDDDKYVKSDMSFAHDRCADKLYECSSCSCLVRLPVVHTVNQRPVCSDCIPDDDP